MTDSETLAEVKARFLRSKDNRKLWDETARKRGVGMALARYRNERGLSQKDIADRTGWDKAFVSRLEGAQGGVPETATLARYVEACGARLGVVIVDEETVETGRARVLGEIDWADCTIETEEHALAHKTARIVEEASLKKIGSDHVETIRDKIRRQQVEIERVGADGKIIQPPKTA